MKPKLNLVINSEPKDLAVYSNFVEYKFDKNDNELNTAVFELREKCSAYMDKEQKTFI